jgi:SAM-dependent methyltransferase
MRAKYWRYYSRSLRYLPIAAVRRLTRRKCSNYKDMEPFLKDKRGLEIGGPSPIFLGGKLIPAYNCCQRIDSCNFSDRTIWGTTADRIGFGGRLGRTFLAEASNISAIPDASYDFVLASHVLEHIANPLRALDEWKRILVPGGVMIVIVPDKRSTFDHKRPFTAFEHIEADFRANVAEDDLTHLDEILALHDLDLDPPAGSREMFRDRCMKNPAIRAMHHHVFESRTLAMMLSHLGIRALSLAVERPNHIVAFGQKVEHGTTTTSRSEPASEARKVDTLRFN